MNAKMRFYLFDLAKNEVGASGEIIETFQKKAGFDLPHDYIEMMKEFNGGEGEVGENGYHEIFPIEDLITRNENYIFLMEQIPDYFLFGKDAADTGYAFNKVNKSIHSFGLMSNFQTDFIDFCGNNFCEFLEYLYNEK